MEITLSDNCRGMVVALIDTDQRNVMASLGAGPGRNEIDHICAAARGIADFVERPEFETEFRSRRMLPPGTRVAETRTGRTGVVLGGPSTLLPGTAPPEPTTKVQFDDASDLAIELPSAHVEPEYCVSHTYESRTSPLPYVSGDAPSLSVTADEDGVVTGAQVTYGGTGIGSDVSHVRVP